jgi:hypothetical protein
MDKVLGYVFIAVAIYSSCALILDLKFYSRRNWDFSVSSGRRLYTGTGGGELTNSSRVKYGYPFCIILFGICGSILMSY